MGGGPTIDGGMTEAQYAKLQMEERKFMSEQEERQMALMGDIEDKRTEREQAEIQKQERLRANEEEALSDLETNISDEVDAGMLDDDEEDKDVVMDFYGSLAENNKGAGGSGASGGKGKNKTSGGRGRPQ
jgi:hypothetical protein